MRLIDADALDFERIENEYGSRNECVSAIEAMIDKAPTVDAEPVRHGYWIVKKTAIGAEYTICSECKTDFKFKTDKGTFARLDMRGMLGCPNCRAKMDKEEQDG